MMHLHETITQSNRILRQPRRQQHVLIENSATVPETIHHPGNGLEKIGNLRGPF